MAIIKMKKATIIALQSEKEKIIKALQDFGGLHMTDTEENMSKYEDIKLVQDDAAEEVNQLEAKLSQVKYSLEFIKRFGIVKKPMFSPKIQLSEENYTSHLIDEQKLNQIYNDCREIDIRFSELKNREAKLNNMISQLSYWKELNVNLEEIKNTRYTNMSIGFVASKYAEEFKNALNAADAKVFVQEVSMGKENTYFFLVYHSELEDGIVLLMKQYGWSRVVFNDMTGTPADNIKRLYEEIGEIEEMRAGIEEKGKALVANTEYLEILSDILTIEKDKKSVVNNFLKTEKTFVLSGWVPESSVDEMTKQMNKVTDNYSLSLEEAKDDEIYPTLLDNPSLAQPVEFITDQYSVPSSRGIDPNVIMAPFFISFFGMMVSDAVYGLFIAAISAAIMIKVKPQGNFKKMIGLMVLGGLSTALWGALFGGWLGGMISIKAILFDPLKEPFMMIGLCVGMGILHLFVGMGLQAYKSIRNGNVLDAVFDQGFWYLFLIGLLMLALPATSAIGKYMAIAGAAGLILTQGRSEKNIIKRLLSGVLSLYNVTGFLGDALSYLRLFALGLATGVIGTVINSMAFMMGGSIIGYFFMIIVLIVGHTFNIGINVLGAYVHSSRLQYVEFFSKFYEGDGIAYNPFRIKTKYIEKR
ncbi:MAG: V-type ATP synthase subunit I [Bacillota bacterium]